jgi:hypothetical protein
VQGPWTGWSHHRWLVDADGPRLEFVHKPAVLHSRPELQLTAEEHAALTEAERVLSVWWDGDLEARERIFMSGEELDAWLAAVPRPGPPRGGIVRRWRSRRA